VLNLIENKIKNILAKYVSFIFVEYAGLIVTVPEITSTSKRNHETVATLMVHHYKENIICR
jgi:hypothetical protein